MARTHLKNRILPIAVALDGGWKESKIWLSRLRGRVWGFKIGSILFTEQGPSLIKKIKDEGFKVFLDLKFHDIPNTVQLSVRQAFRWGAHLLTVHSSGGRAMLEAAASEQRKGQMVVAVTVLTSLDSGDLTSLGHRQSLESLVEDRAKLAFEAGIKGVVCSPQEATSLRARFPDIFLVTPGIRFDSVAQDQKRTSTLRGCFESGSNLAVLGRALTSSKDWKTVWEQASSSLAGIV
jgi:orotidine-5'-phosphate decarboxylase